MKEIIKVIECELLPSHYQLSCYLIFPEADDAIDKDFFINLRSIDYTGHGQAIVVFLQFLTKGPKSICLQQSSYDTWNANNSLIKGTFWSFMTKLYFLLKVFLNIWQYVMFLGTEGIQNHVKNLRRSVLQK